MWDDLGDVYVTQDLLGDVHVQDLLDMLKRAKCRKAVSLENFY